MLGLGKGDFSILSAAQEDSSCEERGRSLAPTAFSSKIPLNRNCDAKGRTHPLVMKNEYCFEKTEPHAARSRGQQQENREYAEAELARLQVN